MSGPNQRGGGLQRGLLKSMVAMSNAGQADGQDETLVLKRFLPLPDYARVLDPSCLLVIGNRGAGKTQLFQALQNDHARRAIFQDTGRGALDSVVNGHWLVGFTTSGSMFPSSLSWNKIAHCAPPEFFHEIWCALLIRVMQNDTDAAAGLPQPSSHLLALGRGDVNQLREVGQTLHSHAEDAVSWLDAANRRLEETGRWIVVSYDELDRIKGVAWEDYRHIIEGLLQFWSLYSRRWKRIRPKIFLRKDLWDRAVLSGSDISKLAAQRVELLWTPRHLYAMLAKRLMNEDDAFSSYLGDRAPRGSRDPHLGWMPADDSAEADYKPMIHQMIGEYMGASYRKGYTFRWLINHCMDSNEAILPRSFLRLFQFAAEEELRNGRAKWPAILHPTSLQMALDKVSELRLRELIEEFPWIKRIQALLREARLAVPVSRTEIERQFESIKWESHEDCPPEPSGSALLRYLSQIGVFYEIPDGRVNVRDIYLKGFGFSRKGGVKRPL